MISIDWPAIVFGLAVGIPVGGLFFVGLAVGMRFALRSKNMLTLLSLSAVFRIGVLLGVGWVVAAQFGLWAAVGFAFAFFLVRVVATTLARAGLMMHENVSAPKTSGSAL